MKESLHQRPKVLDNVSSVLKRIYSLCPGRHLLFLFSSIIVLLHLFTRNNRTLMTVMSENVVRPIHRFLSVINSYIPVSVGELLIIITAVAFLFYFLIFLYSLIRQTDRFKTLYRFLITVISFTTAIYAGFCLLWGVYYYGDNFLEKSGLKRTEISTEQLAAVTEYFADMANNSSYQVHRDESGVYQADFRAILDRSDEVFAKAEMLYPCLSGPAVKAKGFIHSHILSYTDFTGFFFPFTAESNINTDVTSAYFASTVAHELSHQRGVAGEDEANFVAVLASLLYDDPDYVYSASLLAYCYLGNALYKADRNAWAEVYAKLNDNVLRDYRAEEIYWRQFQTPVKKVSNTVYENFLYSYQQELGLQSYGACVDLLVNYYEAFCN